MDDDAGHGRGYVDAKLNLFNVSEVMEKKKKDEDRETTKGKRRKVKKATKTFLPEKNLTYTLQLD